MDNTWPLNIRTGWIVGLALAVLLISATVALIIGAVVTPVSLGVFFMGLGACLTLGLTARVLYQLWGLIHASYELDRNALIIRWGPVEHQIPMGAVQEVLSGAKLEKMRMRPSLRWPGYVVGLGRGWTARSTGTDAASPSESSVAEVTEDEGSVTEAATSRAPDENDAAIDPIIVYAAAPRKEQIIVRTGGVAYAISPADRDAFLSALRERLKMGPTQEVEERSTHPGFLDWSIWQDRLGLVLLGGSAILLILLVGLLCWRYPYLPPEIALRFTPAGDPLLVGPASRIFYFGVLGTAFLVINSSAGLFFYHRERPISYFLWSGLLATLSSMWAATISILLMQ